MKELPNASRNCIVLCRSSGLVSQLMSRSLAWLTLVGKARRYLNWLLSSGYSFTHLLQLVLYIKARRTLSGVNVTCEFMSGCSFGAHIGRVCLQICRNSTGRVALSRAWGRAQPMLAPRARRTTQPLTEDAKPECHSRVHSRIKHRREAELDTWRPLALAHSTLECR